MAATWWLQVRTRNAGFVDVVWAALMGASALLYGALGLGAATPRLLVAMLGGIWGFRLSLHLLSRVLHEAEDGRYRFLRQHWRDDISPFASSGMKSVSIMIPRSRMIWKLTDSLPPVSISLPRNFVTSSYQCQYVQ